MRDPRCCARACLGYLIPFLHAVSQSLNRFCGNRYRLRKTTIRDSLIDGLEIFPAVWDKPGNPGKAEDFVSAGPVSVETRMRPGALSLASGFGLVTLYSPRECLQRGVGWRRFFCRGFHRGGRCGGCKHRRLVAMFSTESTLWELNTPTCGSECFTTSSRHGAFAFRRSTRIRGYGLWRESAWFHCRPERRRRVARVKAVDVPRRARCNFAQSG